VNIGIGIAGYLVLGLIAVGILELTTKRISTNIKDAKYDTQDILAKAGSVVETKTALVLTLLALWVFWPVAIYGACIPDKSKDKK